jgi:hypothetical protein
MILVVGKVMIVIFMGMYFIGIVVVIFPVVDV